MAGPGITPPARSVVVGMRTRPWSWIIVAALLLLVGCDHATKLGAVRLAEKFPSQLPMSQEEIIRMFEGEE